MTTPDRKFIVSISDNRRLYKIHEIAAWSQWDAECKARDIASAEYDRAEDEVNVQIISYKYAEQTEVAA